MKSIKMTQIRQRVVEAARDLKNLPRSELLRFTVNKIKERQIELTRTGEQMNEAELEFGLKEEWKTQGFIFRGAGITFQELLEACKPALTDTSGVFEVDPQLQRIADSKIVRGMAQGAMSAANAATRLVTKVGRNKPCPCGSGIKYKKCCGK